MKYRHTLKWLCLLIGLLALTVTNLVLAVFLLRSIDSGPAAIERGRL